MKAQAEALLRLAKRLPSDPPSHELHDYIEIATTVLKEVSRLKLELEAARDATLAELNSVYISRSNEEKLLATGTKAASEKRTRLKAERIEQVIAARESERKAGNWLGGRDGIAKIADRLSLSRRVVSTYLRKHDIEVAEKAARLRMISRSK